MKTSYSFILTLFFICISINSLIGQEIYTSWANGISGPIMTSGNQIVVDNSGNTYVAGHFFGATDFDPTSGNSLLDGGTDVDGFITKYDNHGNFLWAKQIICNNTILIRDISKDASNNIIITGHFSGSITFDINQSNSTLISLGYNDNFIAKYNSSGTLLWAKQISGSSDEDSYSVVCDNLGNIYSTGQFQGTVDFDPNLGISNLTANGGNPQLNSFILKLNSNGEFVWVKSFVGSVNYSFSSVCNTNGDIFISGGFTGTVDFDPSSNTNNLTSGSYSDFYICKLTSNGLFVWAKQMNMSQQAYIYSMKLDVNGNLLLSGGFKGTIDFDPGNGTNALTSNGNYDIFAQKLDENGNLIWVKQIGGTGSDFCNSMTINNLGNIYLGGDFDGTVDFDPSAANFDITSQSKDMFLLKLTSQGDFEWAEKLGGSQYEEISSISMIPTDNDIIYLTGYFAGSIDMNNGPGQLLINSTNGGSSLFTAKLIPCSPFTATVSANACGSYTWNGNNQTYNSSGSYTANLQNTNGCDSTVTLNLTITNINNSISQNNNILSAVQNGATYTWLDCNNGNQPITGANNQSFTATSNGSYAVQIGLNGCISQSMCTTINTLDLNENVIEFFSIQPNPANEKVIVRSNKPTVIFLTSSNGYVLKKIQIEQETNIDLTDLTSGIYFIKTDSGQLFKLIKN